MCNEGVANWICHTLVVKVYFTIEIEIQSSQMEEFEVEDSSPSSKKPPLPNWPCGAIVLSYFFKPSGLPHIMDSGEI